MIDKLFSFSEFQFSHLENENNNANNVNDKW